jgi:acyl carrier protein
MSDSLNTSLPPGTETGIARGDGVTERVIKCIAETMHMDPARVTPESTFADLGLDSLDGINILFALENEFDLNIPDDAAKRVTGVAGLTEGIRELLAKKGPAA